MIGNLTGSTKDAEALFCKNKQSSFKQLIEKDSSVSSHERNVQNLTTGMYDISNNFSPPKMNEIFQVKNEHSYNPRQNTQIFWLVSKQA